MHTTASATRVQFIFHSLLANCEDCSSRWGYLCIQIYICICHNFYMHFHARCSITSLDYRIYAYRLTIQLYGVIVNCFRIYKAFASVQLQRLRLLLPVVINFYDLLPFQPSLQQTKIYYILYKHIACVMCSYESVHRHF